GIASPWGDGLRTSRHALEKVALNDNWKIVLHRIKRHALPFPLGVRALLVGREGPDHRAVCEQLLDVSAVPRIGLALVAVPSKRRHAFRVQPLRYRVLA